MKHYKETGCEVKLTGWLKEIPKLEMDPQGDFFSTICICVNSVNQNAIPYEVTILKEAALRVRRYGFPGLHLLIEGVLTKKNTMEIIAEKVLFLDKPEPNASSLINNINFLIHQITFNQENRLH